MRIIFDAASKASSRRIDENGFLHITACPITSHGVFDYARCELGKAVGPGDPNELFKVLRDKSVITLPEFIASCQNLPLIDDHTYIEGVVLDSPAGEEASGIDPAKKGVCGVLTNVRYDEESGWVVGDLAIYARQMIRQVMANEKTELSLGFTCVFTPVEGESYAVAQTTMMGNHLALVDRARVPGARVLDSAFPNTSSEDDSMTTKTKAQAKVRALDSSAVDKLRELLLPALQQFLSEEAAEPEHQEPTDPAAVANAATEEEPSDPAVPADPTAEEPAADPADPAPAEDGEDGDIVQLLQQLLMALKPAEASAGDKDPVEPTDEPAKPAGDDAVDPSVESPMTMDAMFQAVAERDQVYQRVSKIVGAFDHSAMTAAKVAQYGVKKLGLKCADGQEMVALDAYLGGVEAATKATLTKTTVGDGVPSSSELDAYLAKKS